MTPEITSNNQRTVSDELIARRIDNAILVHEAQQGLRVTMLGVSPKHFAVEAIKIGRDYMSMHERNGILGHMAMMREIAATGEGKV